MPSLNLWSSLYRHPTVKPDLKEAIAQFIEQDKKRIADLAVMTADFGELSTLGQFIGARPNITISIILLVSFLIAAVSFRIAPQETRFEKLITEDLLNYSNPKQFWSTFFRFAIIVFAFISGLRWSLNSFQEEYNGCIEQRKNLITLSPISEKNHYINALIELNKKFDSQSISDLIENINVKDTNITPKVLHSALNQIGVTTLIPHMS